MPRRRDGYGRAMVSGLVIAGLGLVMFVAAYAYTPAYQGPLTGIGPAFLMIGGLGAMAIGGISAVLAYALGALFRRPQEPDDF